MGQADTSLPDPLTNPQPSPAGTDDLLSQLAGDEIDRLLAEAEVAPPARANELDSELAAAPIPRANTPYAGDAALEALNAVQKEADAIAQDVRDLASASPDDDNLSKGQPSTATPVEEAATEPIEPVQATSSSAEKLQTTAAPASSADPSGEKKDSIASELDSLFAELTTSPASPPAEVQSSPDVVTPEPEMASGEAERSALRESEPELAELAQNIAAKLVILPEAEPLPLYLRPIAWLSAPLDGASDKIRDALGKVAIVTLVNAAALILYVLIFRK